MNSTVRSESAIHTEVRALIAVPSTANHYDNRLLNHFLDSTCSARTVPTHRYCLKQSPLLIYTGTYDRPLVNATNHPPIPKIKHG